MLVVRTPKGRADALGYLVSAEQPVGFHHFALTMNPLGLYSGVRPRAFGGQKAAYDPHPLHLALCDPRSENGLLCSRARERCPRSKPTPSYPPRVELLRAPGKKPGGYPAYGTAIHEPEPRLFELRHIKPVARDGLRIRIVFGHRSFDEARRLALLGPAVQGGQSYPAPPALVLVAYGPGVGVFAAQADQPLAHPFFLAYSGSGLVIQRSARCQFAPMRAKAA